MKIAWVLPGGVDRTGTYRIIPCLLWQLERIARVHELHIFALDQEPRPSTFSLLGATVHNIGARYRPIRTILAIAAEHRGEPFDLIHAFWAMPAGTIAAAAGRLLHKPVLLHLAGGELAALPEIGYGLLSTRRGRLWLRAAVAGAHRVTAPSQAMCDIAARHGIRAERVPMGVALDRWPRASVRTKGGGDRAFRLLWVGSLNRVKDPFTLLRTAGLLRRAGIDFVVDVVGEDTLGGRPAMVAQQLEVAERVRFHGFVPHGELRSYFERADLLLVTSLHEAGPIVALEAAVAGVPVAGTAVGILRDWAPAAAAVAPPGDAAALAEVTAELLRDGRRRVEMAAAAQRRAVLEDADHSSKRWLELYQAMTRRRRDPECAGSNAPASPRRKHDHWPRVVGCLAAGITLACSDGPAVPSGSATILSAVVQETAVPLAKRVDLRLDRPAGIEVTYWAEDTPRLRVTETTAAEEHSVLLARLRAGRDYAFEVRPLAGGSRAEAEWRAGFATAPLPEDLEDLVVQSTGTATYPLVMLEVTRSEGFRGFAIVDGDGEVVWFHRTQGGANGAVRRADGSFVLLDQARGLLHVAPDGRVLAEIAQDSTDRTIHHEVIETSAGTLLFLALDRRAVRDTVVAGEAIWEWDPEAGALDRRWTAWDHFDPETDWGALSQPGDWLHANALAIGPRGNILLSLHFLNQVVSISADRSALEWRLGGVGATIEVPEADRFSGQHTAAEVAPGRVLMFDNGFERTADRYSRAVEFSLDLASGRAEKVWEWRPTPGNWSRIVSLARRLPNGHTFVAFGSSAGFLGSTGPVAAYEVDPEGGVVWQATIEGVELLYRAWPLGELAGEVPAH